MAFQDIDKSFQNPCFSPLVLPAPMDQPKSRGDVILIMWGSYGHVFPFMELARRIIQRGLTCTLLMEEEVRQPVETDLKKLSPVESQGLDVEWLQSARVTNPSEKLEEWERASTPFFETLERERSAGAKGPVCMVVEQFAGWTQKWAKKLMVPRYVFVTSPGMFGYWLSKYSSLIRDDHVLDRVDEDPVLDLPGAPKLHLSECPFMAIREAVFYAGNGDTYPDSAGILLNTFYDLEGSIIDGFHSYLRARRGDRGEAKGNQKPQVFPIGPIALFENAGSDDSASNSKSSCIEWLDSRPRDSVVYIAFGSARTFDMSQAQVHELAKALESTPVSFLWVLIPPPDDSGESVELSSFLPPEFQERTKDRGLVYPHFAPQLQVLSHPAISIFLSHCGWNSVQESIVKGVPLIGWPRHAEQRMCLRILESTGAAAAITDWIKASHWLLVGSADIEKCVRTWVMDGAARNALKKSVLELQRQAVEAVAAGGSSYQNFDKFIQEIQPRHL